MKLIDSIEAFPRTLTYFEGHDYIGGNEYTYWPLKVVREIFNIIDNVEHHPFSFGLIREIDMIKDKQIPIAALRIGISKKDNKLYRFLVMSQYRHDEKTKIAESMKLQGYSDIEIKGIWG